MALTADQQATADQVAALVGDVDLDSAALYQRYVEVGSVNGAAASVWQFKAAQAADLIDVQEGSSKRALSTLRSSYLDMSDRYAALAANEVVGTSGATRTRAIVRTKTLPVKA